MAGVAGQGPRPDPDLSAGHRARHRPAHSQRFPLRLFVTVMLLWYAIAVFHLFLLSFWQEYRVQSLLQVLTDLALVSLVIYATGGIDSSFNFLYPLVIIVACILLPRTWAFLTAALAFILYGTVLELTYFGIVPSYSTTHPELKSLQAIILVNLFGYLAVAYLAGQLATKLRQVDVKLKHTSGALENLQALHENIIQSITGGLITTGLDGHITLANTAAQKLLECPEDSLLGEPVNRLFLDPLPQVGSDALTHRSSPRRPQRLPQDFPCPGLNPRRPGKRHAGITSTLLTISPKSAAWSAKSACRTAWPPWAAWPLPLPTKFAIR